MFLLKNRKKNCAMKSKNPKRAKRRVMVELSYLLDIVRVSGRVNTEHLKLC